MLGKAYCPYCNASFEVGKEQLEVAQGLVRCGRCLEIFDVQKHFVVDPATPQLELPISNDLDFTVEQAGDSPEIPLDLDVSDLHEPLFISDGAHDIHTPVELDVDGEGGQAEWPEDDQHDIYLDEAIEPVLTEEASPIETLLPNEDSREHAQTDVLKPLAMQESQDIEYEFTRKTYRVWPWAAASALLLLTLLMQAAYLFRVDLAARFPASKPLLVDACQLLNCAVPLPQNGSLMSIESSDLTDAQSHIVFNALLRNHAAYTQLFPHLELTLTDTQDTPLSRRTFKPAEYLPPTENEASGLPANHETSIKLYIDTKDIKPSGYRLALIYLQ